MKTGIFLDDIRWPGDVKWINLPKDVEWVTLRTPLDFEEFFKDSGNTLPDVVSFDHDLAFELDGVEQTGYDCLKWLVLFYMGGGLKLPECYFHSMNPVGRKNMEDAYKVAIMRQNSAS